MDAKPEYLLVKRGLYYRPDGHGYTGIKSKAGRYFESDALPDCDVVAVHESAAPEYSDACFRDLMLADVKEKVSKLEAERDALFEALKQAHSWISSVADCDMDEIVADGGITAAMVVHQEAGHQQNKARAAIAAACATHTPAGN